jgi:hypothetical protein
VVASVALEVVADLAAASAEAVVTGKPIRSLKNCLLMYGCGVPHYWRKKSKNQ